MQSHGNNCDCSDCIKIEDEYFVDLADSIDKQNLFRLNESVSDSCKRFSNRKKIFLIDLYF